MDMEQYAYMADSLTQVQEKEIRDLRSRFANPINVEVTRPAEGGFVADIKTFPGCFTEADSFSSLIEMINDAIRTYFEVPEKYAEFMPTYMPMTSTSCPAPSLPSRDKR
jgi:predicted RNase H-like HicB family nuclease